MVISTVYTSNVIPYDEIPYTDMYDLVIDYFQNYCIIHGLEHDFESKIITYNNTKIKYGLFYSPQNERYFLNFIPENVWEWSTKKVLMPAMSAILDFFKSLPTRLVFKQVHFSTSEPTGVIDISDWNFFTEPDLGYNKIKDIQNLFTIRKLGSGILNHYKNKIDRNLIVINATGRGYKSKVDDLISKISPLFKGTFHYYEYKNNTIENILMRSDLDNLFILLFRNGKDFDDEDYRYCKKYFINYDVPSQVINIKNYNAISNWGYENLIFEILKKNLKTNIISLDTLPYGDIDGFLCLSDIYSQKEKSKLFGISISYSGRNTTDDFLEIYNDIEYESSRTNIEFEDENINKLCNKIQALTNLKNAVVDVFVTKRWRLKNVGQLTHYLMENGIKVRRFLYISSKTNRFVFDTLMNENENLHKNPYIIWDGKTASIQCNTKLQLYGTMFPLFIELLNPVKTGDLCEEDLKLILWLVKKRIYRIMNFYSLKTPEILSMFNQVQSLQLENVNKLRLNINSLL